MPSRLERFERIARAAHRFTERDPQPESQLHPFDRRNVHPALPPKVRKLFDDGHYSQATFEAFKFIDKLVQRHSKIRETGWKLMMAAFDEAKPALKLTPLVELSEVDEQRGFRHIFAGAAVAIRNPPGHEVNLPDDPDTCLDHLAFASLLLRRLEQAGFA